MQVDNQMFYLEWRLVQINTNRSPKNVKLIAEKSNKNKNVPNL